MKPAHPKAATSPPSPPKLTAAQNSPQNRWDGPGARTSAFTANIFGQLLRVDPRPLQQHERNPLSRQLLYFYAEFQLQTKNGAHMLQTHVDGSSWGRGALRKSSSGALRAFSCEMLSWWWLLMHHPKVRLWSAAQSVVVLIYVGKCSDYCRAPKKMSSVPSAVNMLFVWYPYQHLLFHFLRRRRDFLETYPAEWLTFCFHSVL